MEQEFKFYVGVDWGTERHQACLIDPRGGVVCQRSIEHSGKEILEFLQFVEETASREPSQIAVAIEVPRGPLVEAFLERQWAVFAINPKQLDRFRDRHTVAGAKDDSRDAFVLADSLRTDQRCFRRVATDHPAILRIRELSRTEDELGGDFRRTVNQLYQLLLRYYPQILQLSSVPDEPWLWVLMELAPTPQKAAKLKVSRLKRLLAQHRIRRWSAEQIAEILASPPLPLTAGSAEALVEHVLLMIPRLRLLSTQRKAVADRMEKLLEEMAAYESQEPETQVFRDVSVMLSLPGVGRIVSGTLLAEGADALRERDYRALRAHSGIAPVTRQSGKSWQVGMRYRCNPRLRNAIYHWARTSVQHDVRSRQQYARLRSVGHGHARALRGVADRLLAVLMAMLKTGRPYCPELRSQAVSPAPLV